MAVGLKIWNASGVVTLDSTTRVGKIIGSFSIGGAGTAQTGSVTDSKLALGTPFNFAILTSSFPGTDKYPSFSFSGTTLNWSYPDPSSTLSSSRPTHDVIYGIF